MVNGVDKLTVSGLGLAYTPSVVICTVSKPSSDDLNIIATVQLNSISADGFTVHFSADPDSSGYKLNYVVFQ